MVTSTTDPVIEKNFPGAKDDGYVETSSVDPDYNCIAWAAGVSDIPWWPTPQPVAGVYWPGGVKREVSLEAFMDAYATLGYIDCQADGSLEEGYEKIVIYLDTLGKPTHAAKQLATGEWSSKLGKYKDISHTTPLALDSSPKGDTEYGKASRYMKRDRNLSRS